MLAASRLNNQSNTADLENKLKLAEYAANNVAGIREGDNEGWLAMKNHLIESGVKSAVNLPDFYDVNAQKSFLMDAKTFRENNKVKPVEIFQLQDGTVIDKNSPPAGIIGKSYPKPEKPDAVRPVVITDPKDPTKSIVVDANDPSKKIGDSPKLPDAQKYTAKEQAKLIAEKPQALQRLNIMKENFATLKENLRQLSDHKGLEGITGSIYGRTGSVADDSVNAQTLYDNVVGSVFVNALQSMRESSKTGGAVGNVSDKEGDKLQNTLSALGRVQTTKQFKEEAKKAMDRLDVSMKNIQDAYDGTYGDLNENQTPTAPSAPYNSKVPPKAHPTARQGLDGRWYVKGENGKSRPVEME